MTILIDFKHKQGGDVIITNCGRWLTLHLSRAENTVQTDTKCCANDCGGEMKRIASLVDIGSADATSSVGAKYTSKILGS